MNLSFVGGGGGSTACSCTPGAASGSGLGGRSPPVPALAASPRAGRQMRDAGEELRGRQDASAARGLAAAPRPPSRGIPPRSAARPAPRRNPRPGRGRERQRRRDSVAPQRPGSGRRCAPSAGTALFPQGPGSAPTGTCERGEGS